MTLSHGAPSCFCPLLVSTPSIFSSSNLAPFPSPALSNIGNGMAQAFDMKDASVHPKKPLKMLTHV